MGKGVWGIDVSKFSAKAVRLEGGRESVTLTRIAVVPYEGTNTGEPVDLDAQVKAALRELKESCKIGSEPVVLSLPSHSTFNRLIKLPPVDDAKIPEIVRYEATSQIPFNIDEVIWDYQYVERTYQPGEEKEVILFAIKKDIVEQFLGNIADLGLNVEAIQFSPVALFNFLLRDQEITGASVALDMGGDNTDLIVLDGTKFWVRNLPITGNNITKELTKAFNIPFEEAEKLKLKAGQSQQAQKIFNAIQPVLRELVNEINRSMGYYKSISKISKFDKLILLGNSTRTLNFQKFISQSLQLPAARIQKLNTIGIGGAVDAGELNENLGTLGTALGLALQGITTTTNRVNLLPPAFLRRKELKKKQPFVVATAVVCYALVGLLWFQQSSAVSELDALNSKANTTNKSVAAQNLQFDEVKKVDDVRLQLDQLVSISTERDLVLKVMDEINPNIPDNRAEGKIDQKLWVVDWKFEEKERKAGAAAAPATPPPAAGAGRSLPTARTLSAVLEVVITKRRGEEEGKNFILRNLLNYNQSRKAPEDKNKPCVVKNKYWELAESEVPTGFWRVEREPEELSMPVPRGYTPDREEQPAVPGGDDQMYWRYRVTLEIPVGEDARKPQPPAEKPAEKK